MTRFVRRQRERQAHPNWVVGFDRNRWPTSVGTGGRIASESVAGLARITQLGFDILGSTLVWERILVVITEDWFALSHFHPLLRELRNLAKKVVVVTRSSGRLEEQALGVRTCNFDLRRGSFNPLSQSK